MKTIYLRKADKLPSFMNWDAMPGLLFATGIAAIATFLQTRAGFALLSPLILAVILGMFVRNTVGVSKRFQPGITFSLKKILRLAIILLGLRLSVGQILDVGPTGLFIVAITLVSTFTFTCWLGRKLGVGRNLRQLIAAGTSICGASAVVATSGAIESSDDDVAYAISVVTLFGTLSMLGFPALNHIALHLSPEAFGIWCGATIHEVAQVVAAAFQGGQISGETATISKLSRVIFLIPVMLFLSSTNLQRGDRAEEGAEPSKLPIPWFVVGFLVLVVLNSFSLFPAGAVAAIVVWNKFLLTISLAAMGLKADLRKVCQTGLKPLYLGAASWLFISVLGLGLITVFHV